VTLTDELLLSRAGGQYWRTGGTVRTSSGMSPDRPAPERARRGSG